MTDDKSPAQGDVRDETAPCVISFLSDLHVEFQRDAGASFVSALDPSGIDVLVLAGDIAVGRGIGAILDTFCRRFDEADVVYVLGNHEHYGTAHDVVERQIDDARRRNPRLHVLDGDVVELRGQRFVGGTLWFRDTPASREHKHWLTDFKVIPGYEPWVFEENARMIAVLERELREGDVVVTHHLPSHACVTERFVGSPLNAFFVCELDGLIRERKPALWIHGHTHDSVDVEIGETRVVCNPFGYAGAELNRAFDDRRRVSLPRRAR